MFACSENGVGYVAVDNVGGTSTKAKLVKSDGSSLYLSRFLSVHMYMFFLYGHVSVAVLSIIV